MMNTQKHALVVGGTGMLSKTTQWIVDQGYSTSVIARNKTNLPKVNWINVNYQEVSQIKIALLESIKTFGPIVLIVSWIHDYAKDTAFEIANIVSQTATDSVDFYQILGGVSPDFENIKNLPRIRYHKVILGSVTTGNGFRWLTNQEISEGVIEAIKNHKTNFMVGSE